MPSAPARTSTPRAQRLAPEACRRSRIGRSPDSRQHPAELRAARRRRPPAPLSPAAGPPALRGHQPPPHCDPNERSPHPWETGLCRQCDVQSRPAGRGGRSWTCWVPGEPELLVQPPHRLVLVLALRQQPRKSAPLRRLDLRPLERGPDAASTPLSRDGRQAVEDVVREHVERCEADHPPAGEATKHSSGSRLGRSISNAAHDRSSGSFPPSSPGMSRAASTRSSNIPRTRSGRAARVTISTSSRWSPAQTRET